MTLRVALLVLCLSAPALAADLKSELTAAVSLMRARKYAEAARLLEPLLKANPDDPKLLQVLAIAEHRVGRSDLATKLARRLAALDPKNETARKLLAPPAADPVKVADAAALVAALARGDAKVLLAPGRYAIPSTPLTRTVTLDGDGSQDSIILESTTPALPLFSLDGAHLTVNGVTLSGPADLIDVRSGEAHLIGCTLSCSRTAVQLSGPSASVTLSTCSARRVGSLLAVEKNARAAIEGGSFEGPGLSVTAGQIAVRNARFSSETQGRVTLTSEARAALTSCVLENFSVVSAGELLITGCSFKGGKSSVEAGGAKGRVTLEGGDLTGRQGGPALRFENGAQATIRNCKIAESSGWWLEVQGKSRCAVEGVEVEGCYPAQIGPDSELTLKGSRIHDGHAGLAFTGASAAVENVEFVKMKEDGLTFSGRGPGGMTLRGCTFRECHHTAVHAWKSPAKLTIEKCTFEKNGKNILAEKGATVDARDNKE